MAVGIVMPAYNASRWIGAAIGSVIKQTHSDWIMVAVDDGSTDGTAAIVREIHDARITLVQQANAGVSAARNRGTSELLSRVVTALLYLDADDRLAPDALARMVTALDNTPGAVAAVGPHVFVDTGFGHVPPSGDLLEPLLECAAVGNIGSILFRSDALRAAGAFRSDLSFGEDWEFLIRIALQGPFAATSGQEPVLFINPQPTGLFRSGSNPAAYAACTEAIFSNPAVSERLGKQRLAAARRRAEANNAWAMGRVLIRQQRNREGRAWLYRSLRQAPSPKRAAILVAVYASKILPGRWLGPFQPYATTTPSRSFRLNSRGRALFGNMWRRAK